MGIGLAARSVLLLGLVACAPSLEGPQPTLLGTSPALVCNQQLETEVLVSGEQLAPMLADALSDPTAQLPELTLRRAGDVTGTPAGDGQSLVLGEQPDADLRWLDSQTMAFDVTEALAVSDGLFDLSVTSPAGDSAALPASLTSVPAPTLDSLSPQLICDEQYDNSLALTGTGILVVQGQLPELHVGEAPFTFDEVGACLDLAGPTAAQSCSSGTVTVPRDGLPTGVWTATVANPAPAACASVETVTIQVVDAPHADLVDPQLTCVDQGEQELVVNGDGFLVIDGVYPAVQFGDYSADATAADGCTQLEGPVSGQSCTELSLTLPQDAVDDGVVDIVITNPAPAGCASTDALRAQVVRAPTLLEVQPLLECTDQGEQELLLSGVGLVVLDDGTLPLVTVGDYSASAILAEGCTDLAGPAGGQTCTELSFLLPAETVPSGVVQVSVTNPESYGCTSQELVELELIDAPTLEELEPQPVCVAEEDKDLTLQGTGFLFRADGSVPTVTVGTATATVTGGDACASLSGPEGGEVCEFLTATLAAGSLSGDSHDVTVTNPETAECATLDSVQLQVVDAPSLTSLDPEGACSETDPNVGVTLTGTGFLVIDGVQPSVTVAGNEVLIDSVDGCTTTSSGAQSCTSIAFALDTTVLGDGEHAIVVTNPGEADCPSTDFLPFVVTDPPAIDAVTPEEVCEGGESVTVTGSGFVSTTSAEVGNVPAVVTYVSDTEISVEIPPEIAAGTYDLEVSNIEGCATTVEDAVTVLGAPTVFYVDPPVVYSEISIQATVYVTGVNDGVSEVWLEEDTSGDLTSLDFTVDSASRVSAIIPSGLDDGSYHLGVEDSDGCTDQLDDALSVSSDLTVAVDAVDPPFGSALDRTAVEVTAEDPAPSGMVQFEDVPRLYLNPAAASTDTVATALSSVSYEDDTLLDAIVPAGLEAGTYDLLVINPSGDIGLLEGEYVVTDQYLATISGVSPSSLANADDEDVTITGENFDAAGVTVLCEDPDGTTTEDTATILSASSTSIDATIPSSLYDTGTVCVVRVEQSDDTWSDYASIAITNSSGNIYGWEDGPELTTARRATAAAVGRSTATARYVYAIGGDDGEASGAMSSIEFARLGQYGDLGDWELLTDALPEARTLASIVRVDDFIYLVGGHDGSTAVDSAWRARVLDPGDAPQVSDIAVAYADSVGLGEGTWIYRVSALFAEDDALNPGGESLAGDPFVVRLPATSGGIELTLEWDEVDGASGYRIYRTSTADAGSGTEQWLDDVDGGSTTSFTDTADRTDGSVVPLVKGALGQWAELDTLSTAREGAMLSAGVDPDDPATWYLFVAGGLDSSGLALDSIEYLDITSDSDGDQAAGTWTTSAESLTDARWYGGAWAVTSDLHTVVTGSETWLYFGGGYTVADDEDGGLDAGQVAAGGDLTGFTAVDSLDSRGAFGTGSAGDYLYAFGGTRAGSVIDDGRSAELCGPSTGGGCSDLPDLRNWNSLGVSMASPRAHPGTAQASGVLIVVGGATDAVDATATTETTNF